LQKMDMEGTQNWRNSMPNIFWPINLIRLGLLMTRKSGGPFRKRDNQTVLYFCEEAYTMKLMVFLVITIGIAIFSWPYLRDPRTYGFFRFFAFETIVLLVLSNSNAWFRNPFTLLQILSWLFLLGSLLLAIHGFYLLKMVGKPEGGWEDTTHLVKRGAYRYIRHPLYSSLLLFGAGALLKNITLTSVGLYIALVAFLIATAMVEETENVEQFSSEYTDYKKMTKMFVPFIF
jgi:protein-S-isoprenylcysteine O-methyltransferase Ste14